MGVLLFNKILEKPSNGGKWVRECLTVRLQQHIALINTHQNTVRDVPADQFIAAFARHLKKGNKIKIPDVSASPSALSVCSFQGINHYILQWCQYQKTSCAAELAPYDADWLYTRAASICYQLYMLNGSGVKRLRHHYGGKQRRGTKTEHARIACGKNIRYCLNELKKSGLVSSREFVNDENKTIVHGKVLNQKGVTDMDRIAAQIGKEARKH